ncbi:TD and POZ domain-containing protein 5-like [Argiope bruennichi]|uniref:TD and POZ domain-containing protein 5-like n=1 Tax=Argiope bruennichi TaxID=94029 RepID=UPI0024953EB3|nr:TD and POZ domain-containing protein 5-like [Argiope bruennichi]
MHNLSAYVAFRQHGATQGFLSSPKENSLFAMEMPVVTDPGAFKKCGKLTKKDVLRWSVDSGLFRTSDSAIRSDFFKFGPCPDSKFYMVAFSNASNTFFTVGLCRLPLQTETENNLSIRVSFSLLDLRDRCHHTCERTLKDMDSVQASFDKSCYTNHHLMFLREGKVIIHCSMDVDEILQEDSDEQSIPVKKSIPVLENLNRDLADDLSNLLQNRLHTDVTLNVAGEEFHAHRAILAARSPVFAKMFEHETLEKNNNRIVIEDLSSDAMKQLLRYLYTGDTDELSTQELVSLFVAADKYDLPKLKKNCSASLCSRVTSDMALNVLVVANLHGDEDLKSAAIQTVLDNAVDVMKSEEWLSFLREYPEVANTQSR